MSAEAKVAAYSAVVVSCAEQLGAHVAAWDDLAQDAVEPNVFYESWALLPALRAFGTGSEVDAVLIYRSPDGPLQSPLLCGFVPLRRRRVRRWAPVTVVEPWQHLYCFLSTPLLRRGHAVGALDALFDCLVTRYDSPLLRLDLVTGDGGFARTLVAVCGRRGLTSFVAQSYCRAMIEPRSNAESYLREALAGRHRKEFRRIERLLAKRGRFERREFKPGDDASHWADLFLQLESEGWKGRGGTAMASVPADARYFREIVRGAADQGKLAMLGLFLDGKPIALKCNFSSGTGSFAFKIAFDEAHKAVSPGVLLELANIDKLHDSAATHWMDSCAVAEHSMINRLWLERRLIVDQYVATGRAPGHALVAVMPIVQYLKNKLRRPGES